MSKLLAHIAIVLAKKLVPKAIDFLGANLKPQGACQHFRPSGMDAFVAFRSFPSYSVTICTECAMVQFRSSEVRDRIGKLDLN